MIRPDDLRGSAGVPGGSDLPQARERAAPEPKTTGSPRSKVPRSDLDPALDGVSLRSAAISQGVTDAEFDDADTLWSAVRARLALTISDGFGARIASPRDNASTRLPANVLECMADLDRLHDSIADDIGRQRQAVIALQRAVANAQVELANTQLGERLARHLALHDSLTRLPNSDCFRGVLDQALAQAAEQPQPIAVLYLDLDGFKAINDSYGHDTGDAVLRIVAVRLTGAIRAEDRVCRIGGDEFACMLAGVPDRAQLSHLVCKLFDAVAGPLQVGQLALSIRPSIGVAMCPENGTASDALLRNADAAMYRAKREKCGYAFFDEQADGWSHDSPPRQSPLPIE